MNESRRTSEQLRKPPNENQTTSENLSHKTSEHQHTHAKSNTEMSSLFSPASVSVVTLPVLTPDTYYDASAGTYAPAIVANNDGNFYGSSDLNSNTGANIKVGRVNDGICRYCGYIGVAKSEFCFGEKGQKHDFYFQGDLREPVVEKPKKLRGIWKILLILVLLFCYGISIAYIIIPIQKYLTQDVVTSVAITTASEKKPIPFPGIQICSSNPFSNLTNFDAYFLRNGSYYEDIEMQAVVFHDYGYDIECWEVCNYKLEERLHAKSRRDAIIITAEIEPYKGNPLNNSYCLLNSADVCDEKLPDDAVIYDVDPLLDSWGVSLGTFAADGEPRSSRQDDLTFLTAGGLSRVSLSYSRSFRFEQKIPEESYSTTASRVKYSPGAYAINYFENHSLPLESSVFAIIEFGQLSFTEVNETKTYEIFNAFGDATAILGFFTGFGVFAGPAFLDLFLNHAHRPCWANMFYK